MGLPGGTVVKNLPAKAGDTGSIPGSGRLEKEVATGKFLCTEALGRLQFMVLQRVGHD